jgi:hypothetical protein
MIEGDLRAIHGRFTRLFLEHKAQLGLAHMSDAEIVDKADAVMLALMSRATVATRKHDVPELRRLSPFVGACQAELEEVARSPRTDA